MEFCVGTVAEMTEGNIYEAIEQYSRQGKIAYIHLRNVIGKAPHYRETFIDEGDVDMIRVLSILKRNALQGVLIPDHTPQMSCAAPWHAGMTHTLGFVLAVLAMLESPSTQKLLTNRAVAAVYDRRILESMTSALIERRLKIGHFQRC
jgi:mannonate dehydratase